MLFACWLRQIFILQIQFHTVLHSGQSCPLFFFKQLVFLTISYLYFFLLHRFLWRRGRDYTMRMGFLKVLKTQFLCHLIICYVFLVSGFIINLLQICTLPLWPINKQLARKINCRLGYSIASRKSCKAHLGVHLNREMRMSARYYNTVIYSGLTSHHSRTKMQVYYSSEIQSCSRILKSAVLKTVDYLVQVCLFILERQAYSSGQYTFTPIYVQHDVTLHFESAENHILPVFKNHSMVQNKHLCHLFTYVCNGQNQKDALTEIHIHEYVNTFCITNM